MNIFMCCAKFWM